jgi:hypothetical protein
MAVMQRTGSSTVGKRWPIIPKWEDRQVCRITCWAETRRVSRCYATHEPNLCANEHSRSFHAP